MDTVSKYALLFEILNAQQISWKLEAQCLDNHMGVMYNEGILEEMYSTPIRKSTAN